jgi:hypothetical protein
MRFAVDPWAPDYGAAAAELRPTRAAVDVAVECAPGSWAPRRPPVARGPSRVRFVDGVRRVDARLWIDGPDGVPRQGVAASYAAGAVRCDPDAARIETCTVRRAVFSAAPDLAPVGTRRGTWEPRAAAAESDEELLAQVQQRMRDLEVEVAAGLGDSDLLVVDGTLPRRSLGPHAVGYAKTHHTSYLPGEQAAVVGALGVGERTPLFLATTASLSRYSWYLRLPGGAGHPWAGVVRCEAPGDLDPAQARRLADLATATLPRYASTPAKDPRAPANLHPIADLERHLRHRLGDPALCYRALTQAATPGGGPVVGVTAAAAHRR